MLTRQTSANSAAQRSRRQYALAGLVGLLVCLVAGCRNRSAEPAPPPSAARASGQRVIAQGLILPATGMIHLMSQPGDPVQEMRVAVGQQVEEGQVLAIMRSEALRTAQRQTLEQQRRQAERELRQAITAAEQAVAAAQLQLDQVQAQQQALTRNAKLLGLAEQQVAASRGVLSQLEALAANSLTSEFVGKLEVDRQRLALGEAELEFARQQEQHQQADDDLRWAQLAAEQQLQAARSALKQAQASQAVDIFDSQLAALELEAQAARIVAPQAGVILAINASQGETSFQQPLIEMANTSRMVCEVEINELDAALVAPGQTATIRSRAFSEPLKGTVREKFQLVGRPQLRPLDPLARVDYRTVTAVIELAEEPANIARDWLQLQVEVEIAIE